MGYILKIFFMIIAFFLGISLLVHICSKNKYILKYTSEKRKIEIYPAKQDKSHPQQR